MDMELRQLGMEVGGGGASGGTPGGVSLASGARQGHDEDGLPTWLPPPWEAGGRQKKRKQESDTGPGARSDARLMGQAGQAACALRNARRGSPQEAPPIW